MGVRPTLEFYSLDHYVSVENFLQQHNGNNINLL